MGSRLFYAALRQPSCLAPAYPAESEQARNPENSSTCFVHPIGRPLKLMKAEDLIEIRIADGSVVTEGCYGGHCEP